MSQRETSDRYRDSADRKRPACRAEVLPRMKVGPVTSASSCHAQEWAIIVRASPGGVVPDGLAVFMRANFFSHTNVHEHHRAYKVERAEADEKFDDIVIAEAADGGKRT